MVTPALGIVGAPNFLSKTTLRPRGPSVTLTVSASLSTPRSRERGASSLNLMILAMPDLSERLQGDERRPPRDPGVRVAGAVVEELERSAVRRGHFSTTASRSRAESTR